VTPVPLCTVPQLPAPIPVVKASSLGFGLKPQHCVPRVVVVVTGVVVVVVVVATGAVVVVVAAGPVVVVVAAGAVVVVAVGAVVVVLLGGQGFGEQVPAPALIPFWVPHSVSLRSKQSTKAPIGDDCSQHWIGACVVVVVAPGPVVVVVVAAGAVVVDVSVATVVVVVSSGGEVVVVLPPVEHEPPAPHASQQLDCDPTHAVPPGGAVQLCPSCLIEQVVLPLESVWQQVTKPGLPQVDAAAQSTTASLHAARSSPSSMASFTTCATQLTYLP